MLGILGLLLRVALIALGGGLAGHGIGEYNPDANTITFNLDAVAQMVAGAVTVAGTFIAGRIVKAKGGHT